jgi:hypothetical protein
MFPFNQKTHKMETRETEKFKVQYALTDRLKKSALIYLQNLLNQHEDQNKWIQAGAELCQAQVKLGLAKQAIAS